MRQLVKVLLDIEPVTWGTNDAEKRQAIRREIRKHIPDFGEEYTAELLRHCRKIEVELDCYLVNPETKDIDNLAKIPLDALFFSAQNEKGYRTWESKVTSLLVKKIASSQNRLGIVIRGDER